MSWMSWNDLFFFWDLSACPAIERHSRTPLTMRQWPSSATALAANIAWFGSDSHRAWSNTSCISGLQERTRSGSSVPMKGRYANATLTYGCLPVWSCMLIYNSHGLLDVCSNHIVLLLPFKSIQMLRWGTAKRWTLISPEKGGALFSVKFLGQNPLKHEKM